MIGLDKSGKKTSGGKIVAFVCHERENRVQNLGKDVPDDDDDD